MYRGGTQPHVGADPLHYLTGVGNSGGFRTRTVDTTGVTALCVLFSTGAVSEWPDGWDDQGKYGYYGDQRQPGREVLDTPRKGNRLLADVQAWTRRGEQGRSKVPPFLLFEKDGPGRDVQFEGLLVPANQDDWLALERRSMPNGVVANYRATLRRLPIDKVSRQWLTDILQGYPHGSDRTQTLDPMGSHGTGGVAALSPRPGRVLTGAGVRLRS